MNEITSVSNPLIKQVTSLKTKKGRQKYGQCIAEGLRTIKTLIEGGWQPIHLFATSDQLRAAQNNLGSLPITLVTDTVMKKISSVITPSGLLAAFKIPEAPDTSLVSSGIVLARIADPGNMGTLIRTCAAFGKQTVVIIEGCDPYSPKVIQSTAGSIAHINLFQLSWDTLINIKRSLQLFCLVPQGGQIPYKLSTTDGLLVIGSEAHGIPTQWAKMCQHQLTIPMPGRIESLNAAVAGAIGMYALWINSN